MIIPTLAGWATGEKVTAAKLTDHTKTAIERGVYYKPYCSMSVSGSGQSISTGTETRSTLSVVTEDRDSMADVANNAIVIKTAGLYRVTAIVGFAQNTTGQRWFFVKLANNSILLTVTANTTPGLTTNFGGSKTLRLSAGDSLRLMVQQNSGVALNLDSSTTLQAEWISL